MPSSHAQASSFFLLLLLLTFTLFSVHLAAANEGALRSGHATPLSHRAIAASKRTNIGRRIFGDELSEDRVSQQHLLGELLVVASIEGGLYGLDRETGSIIWSLPPHLPTVNERNETVEFSPLVGTTYGPKHRSFADLTTDVSLVDAPHMWDGKSSYDGKSGREALENLQDLGLYVVEPSNGQVFILSTDTLPSDESGTGDTSSAKLSKLPLTLPQLVELSPFSFPGDASRIFVGHKSTSLVEINIRTGELGVVFGGHSKGRDSVWCGSNRNTTGDASSSSTEAHDREHCAEEEGESTDWAYIGRNDYTLSIHMRGRPALSQTLTFSTFVANAADQEVANFWSSLQSSPDRKVFMAMPEEKSVVCFDARVQANSPREHQDRTLWISELSATAAGIFDTVYPASLVLGEKRRPLLVPHPARSLDFLLGEFSAESEAIDSENGSSKVEPAYLGISDGLLYVMGGKKYPLVAFSPRAPAGLPSWKYLARTNDKQSTRSCASYGCLIGTYEVNKGIYGEGNAEELLGLGPGHAPFLGIEDGSTESAEQNEPAWPSPTASQTQTQDSSRPHSIWFTPSMIASQIMILLLLACLCGLLYVGGQEMRKQQAEEASAASRNVTFATLPSLAEVTERGKSGQVAPTSFVKSDGASRDKDVTTRSEVVSPAIDARESASLAIEKKKGKRRRRGKRGGIAVALRGSNRGESVGDDDDDDDEDESEKGDASTDANKSTSSDSKREWRLANDLMGRSHSSKQKADEDGLKYYEDTLTDADVKDVAAIATAAIGLGTIEQQADSLGESASRNAEEGGDVFEDSGGQKIATRGENRSLVISEEILGYGSSGTVVFKGTFQGRAVAVKRLLRDFVDVATKEVSLLESADSHANVIRYYYKEATGNFLFIALELCPASLSEIIERPNDFVELGAALKPKKALSQIASGLQHLHSLSIVHRDIKPQNILVSRASNGQLKMLLSDFGLSKRLDGATQASFSQTINNPGGTFGWRAPEILRGEVMLDLGSASNRDHSTGSNVASPAVTNEEKKRLTRAVDIFALGCVFYYVLSNGDHPFGARYERELNIMRGVKNLSRLDGLGEEGHEAQHLVEAMVSQESSRRLSATETLSHPYFWDASRRLAFLQDTSDRFDVMERDPPAPPLIALEKDSHLVIGMDWHRKLDKVVMEDLNKRRSYDQKSLAALLRAIRNKKHHIHDISPQVRRILTGAGGARATAGGASADTSRIDFAAAPLLPDGFLAYFTTRFPRLFLHTYEVVNRFEMLKAEASFAPYFRPLQDSG